MKILIKTLNLIITIFIIFLILINIFFIYSKIVLKQPIVKIFNRSVLIIVSGSMEPELNINDLIFIKEYSEYKEGDVVTFISDDNTVITHRIIKIDGDLIYTKGDNNNIEDSKPISSNQIQGKVDGKITNFGIITEFIKSPIGITIIVALNYLIFRYAYKSQTVQNNK